MACKPQKANGVKKRGAVHGGGYVAMTGRWFQEARAHLAEQEQTLEAELEESTS